MREVKLVSKWGELRFGMANDPDDRATVTVRFDLPIPVPGHPSICRPLVLGYPYMGRTSLQEEFRKSTGCRVIWGQGIDEDVDDWRIKDFPSGG